MTMLSFLGQALREAREEVGDVSLRDVDILDQRRGGAGFQGSKLSRLERGQHRRWPADIDEIVSAYALACGTTPKAIWNRALELNDEAEARGRHDGKSAARRARERAGKPEEPSP